MRSFVYILLSMFIMSSCIPSKNARKRRAKRKHEKAVFLWPQIHKEDTLIVRDTIFIDRFSYDTVSTIIYNDSVVVINNERLRVEYHMDSVTNQIYVQGECKGDTVTTEKKIIVERTNNEFIDEVKDVPYWIWIAFAGMLLIIYIFGRVFEKRHNTK